MIRLIAGLMICLLGWLPGNSQIIESHSVGVNVTIPEVAILDIAPNTSTIELDIESPKQAGDPVNMSNAADESKWINYSSSLSPGSARRKITAQIISGSVPSGFDLRLKAGNSSGGKGKRGKSAGEIVLNKSPQTIIKNIGGAFTGRGIQQGHKLSFTLRYKDYADIEFGASSIVVAFTLTDQ